MPSASGGYRPHGCPSSCCCRRHGSCAVQTGRRREHPHRVHEFIDGDPAQDLDVLEDILCELWARGLDGLSVSTIRERQSATTVNSAATVAVWRVIALASSSNYLFSRTPAQIVCPDS